MSEDRRLRDKLTKLATDDGGTPARRLSPASHGTMTQAVLEEIDETILPRTLVFRSPDGETLSLEAANRRLLGITECPDDLASGPERERLLAPLAPDNEDALAAVADAIARFASDRTELTVAAAPASRGAGPGMLGRSAAAVARALGIELYDRPEPVPMPDPAKGFDAGLARLSLAVSVIFGALPAPATGPDPDAVGRLSALGRDDLARIAGELGPEAGRAGRFLLLFGGEEALFVGQKDADRAVVALLPSDHAGAVAALWQATNGA